MKKRDNRDNRFSLKVNRKTFFLFLNSAHIGITCLFYDANELRAWSTIIIWTHSDFFHDGKGFLFIRLNPSTKSDRVECHIEYIFFNISWNRLKISIHNKHISISSENVCVVSIYVFVLVTCSDNTPR
jgi:hypothetical protein